MLLKPKELRALELETLKVVGEIGEFGRVDGLQSAASAARSRINERKGSVSIHLGFVLDIRLRADRRREVVARRIDLGALVEVDAADRVITNASYSIIICRYKDPAESPIVRKLHFDYEPASLRNFREPKPTNHIQVCGKLSPVHREVGYADVRLNGLYPKFEKPRIPVAPMSVALLLNWLLLEFQTDSAAEAILREPRWRAHVARAERVVLTPYYDAAARFLKNAGDKERRFLQSHVYELAGD